MAKQKGILPIEGTLGNITFFKSKDGYMAKQKSEVSADKIATDPVFQRTRENNAEFGRAGKGGKLLRTAFRSLLQKTSDGRMIGRLTASMMDVIHEDDVNPRGLRNVIDGEALLLEGFDFNINGKLSTALFAPYSVTLNRTTGAVSVNVPSFTPSDSIAAPAGTTHFKISIAAGDIDFEAETFNADSGETAYIAWNNASAAAIDLSLNVPAASTHPIFVLLALEFVQDVNNVKYTLNNGAFNACAIIKVDTP